jgi:hypothetical protein
MKLIVSDDLEEAADKAVNVAAVITQAEKAKLNISIDI